jgi:hypothetical protein
VAPVALDRPGGGVFGGTTLVLHDLATGTRSVMTMADGDVPEHLGRSGGGLADRWRVTDAGEVVFVGTWFAVDGSPDGTTGSAIWTWRPGSPPVRLSEPASRRRQEIYLISTSADGGTLLWFDTAVGYVAYERATGSLTTRTPVRAVSANGRYVASSEPAPRWPGYRTRGVTGDELFVTDRLTGRKVMASHNLDGYQGNDAVDLYPHFGVSAFVTDTGSVVYPSASSDLVPGTADDEVAERYYLWTP